MSFSYKPLWKLLIDKDMTKKELMQKTRISKSTMDKMGRGEKILIFLRQSVERAGQMCYNRKWRKIGRRAASTA